MTTTTDLPPLLLIHGFTGNVGSWQTLRPLLEPHHHVVAVATLGHFGGAPIPADMADPLAAMVADVESQMDKAGIQTAHLVGSSLGGLIAIELAARGRARSLVAIAPGGGWEEEKAVRRVLGYFRRVRRLTPWSARNARQLVARPRLRKLVLRDVVTHGDRVPAAVAAGMIAESAHCTMFEPLLSAMQGGSWHSADLGPIDVPARVIWGTKDRILPMEVATGHWRRTLRNAEWVEMDGLGHLPHLDDPQGVAGLVLEVTAPERAVLAA